MQGRNRVGQGREGIMKEGQQGEEREGNVQGGNRIGQGREGIMEEGQ